MRDLGTRQLLFTLLAGVLVALASCGGNAGSVNGTGGGSGTTAASGTYDICHCAATEDPSGDYRHAAKHVTLPSQTPQEIGVSDILGWSQDTAARDVPDRVGRELQLFHIAQAYLQNVYLNPGDCDIHFEISQTADRNAPRVIVETPGDDAYCSARQGIQQQLAARGLTFPLGGDLVPPATVDVLGLAFEDFGHLRGSEHVSTVWELHPAIVKITGQ